MHKETVFITGGSGFVGSRIISSLLINGYGVKALVRSVKGERLQDGVEAVLGDILDPDPWRDSVIGSDLFINLVGIIREFPDKGITFEKLHVEATAVALEVCRYAKVARYLHMSANGASPEGVSEYQRTKYRAEQFVMNSELKYTIFRPSLIFGAGDKFLNVFAEKIKSFPAFPIFGNGDYELQPVSVQDVAEAYIKSIHNEKCYNKVFHLGGSKTYRYIDLIRAISSALGQKVYLPKVPAAIMRLIAKYMGKYAFFPITLDQLNMLLEGNVCPETKIFETLDIKQSNLDNYIIRQFSDI